MKTLFFIGIFSCSIFSFGFSQADESEFSMLFQKYQQNNTEYQKSIYLFEQAKNSLQMEKVQNGLNFTLSSGNMNVVIGNDDTVFSMSPKIVASSSVLNNSSVTVEVPYYVSSVNPSTDSGVDNASVLLSTDIYSSVSKQTKLALEKSERSLLEAKRNLLNKTIEVHISFLNELNSLFSAKQEIFRAEDNLLDKQEDFQSVKAKGYLVSSAKYRTAKLQVESAERAVEEKKRSYEQLVAVFASKCSMSAEELDLDFDLPEIELIEFSSLEKENYVALEKAQWNKYITEKEKNIDTSMRISAQAGYGFSAENDSFENKIKAGSTFTYDGFVLSALATIPVDGSDVAALTFALSWNPSTGKINDLKKQNKDMDFQIQGLSVIDANESYKNSLIEQDEKRRNLDWKLLQYEEEVGLYSDLEKDTIMLYEKGLVSESDYREAKLNLADAKNKLAQTKIERALYNDNILKLFVPQTGVINEN